MYTFNVKSATAGTLSFLNNDGNEGAILDNVKLSSVPLPGTLTLQGSGLFGLLGFRRNKYLIKAEFPKRWGS